MVNGILMGLSVVGLGISSYFTAVAYRWLGADELWIPSFCRMGKQTCASIVFAPQARVFGPPNSLLGLIYYLALLGGTLLGLLDRPPVLGLFLAASLLTVVLAVYLSYSLLFVVRVPCKLCFTSHGINTIIFVLLLSRVSW